MNAVRRTVVLLWARAGSTCESDSSGWLDQMVATASAHDEPEASTQVVLLVVTPGAQSALTQEDGLAVVSGAPETWWREAPTLLGLSVDDLVIVAESGSTPSPHLVSRLVSAYDDHVGAVVDARVIPLEVRQVATPGAAKRFDDNEEDDDEGSDSSKSRCVDDGSVADPDTSAAEVEAASPAELVLPTEHQVSGACTLLDVRTLDRVGKVWSTGDAWAEGGGAADRLVSACDSAGLQLLVEPRAALFRSIRVAEDGAPAAGSRDCEPELDDYVPHRSDHPAALDATMLSRFLKSIGMRGALPVPDDPPEQRPFLTVVTRTQGARPQPLEEVLTCLTAQTDRDFELLVMCHRTSPEAVVGIVDLVSALPQWMRERVRVVEVDRPGRSAPLNDGFEMARGRYIAMLDDDDVVLEHWVETFHRLEAHAEGQMLRAGALLQPVVDDPRFEGLVPMSAGNAIRNWPLPFRLVDHLRANYTPCMSVAFPRGTFHLLGLRFDETLDTTEDWDLIVRTAGVVGVESAHEVTSIYRWWEVRGSSREVHTEDEWDTTMQRVAEGFQRTPLLLSPEGMPRFGKLLNKAAADAKAGHDLARELATSQHEVIGTLQKVKQAHDHAVASRREWQARTKKAKARVDEVRARLNERHGKHLELLREVDLLLVDRPQWRPAESIFDLEPQELRALVARLREEPARRSLGDRFKPRR